MSSTGRSTVVEPTAEQLERMDTLRSLATAARAQLVAVEGGLAELERSGLHMLDTDSKSLREVDHLLADLRITRVAGGRESFSDWLVYRVRLLYATAELSSEVGLDHLPHFEQVLAIENRIREVDPDLQTLLAAARELAGGAINHLDDRSAKCKLQMTGAQLEQRAEAVITRIIDSGWRP